MVSVLLMSRALQKSSIAGCQISLGLKSALSISAHCTQGGKSRQSEDEHDLCAYSSHASYIDLYMLHIHMHMRMLCTYICIAVSNFMSGVCKVTLYYCLADL